MQHALIRVIAWFWLLFLSRRALRYIEVVEHLSVTPTKVIYLAVALEIGAEPCSG